MVDFLIVHDSDNNLVDEAVSFHAYRSLALSFGAKPEDVPDAASLNRTYTGKSYETVIRDLEKAHGFRTLDRYADFRAAFTDHALQQQAENLRLLPFVRGTLEILNRADITQCVASNNSRAVILNGYRLLGIEDYFSSFTTSDHVAVHEQKPHPKILQLAMQRHAAAPDITIHVEDSNTGLEAGHRAGIRNLVWHTAMVPADQLQARSDAQMAKGIHPRRVIGDYSALLGFVLEVAPEPVRENLEGVIAYLNAKAPARYIDPLQNAAAYAATLRPAPVHGQPDLQPQLI